MPFILILSFGKSKQKQSANSKFNLLFDRKSIWLSNKKSTFVRKLLLISLNRHVAAVYSGILAGEYLSLIIFRMQSVYSCRLRLTVSCNIYRIKAFLTRPLRYGAGFSPLVFC